MLETKDTIPVVEKDFKRIKVIVGDIVSERVEACFDRKFAEYDARWKKEQAERDARWELEQKENLRKWKEQAELDKRWKEEQAARDAKREKEKAEQEAKWEKEKKERDARWAKEQAGQDAKWKEEQAERDAKWEKKWEKERKESDKRLEKSQAEQNAQWRIEMNKMFEENNKVLISLMLEYFPTKEYLEQRLRETKEELRTEFRERITAVQECILSFRKELDMEVPPMVKVKFQTVDKKLASHGKRITALERSHGIEGCTRR